MQEIEFLGLSNPNPIVVFIMYIIFLMLSFFALESVDYSKILRKELSNRAILLHTLLSVALAYLLTNFFLAVVFQG